MIDDVTGPAAAAGVAHEMNAGAGAILQIANGQALRNRVRH
jgi:hypothetical protein